MNPHRGEVALKLGERVLVLRPTFEAIAGWESKTGCGTVELCERIQRKRWTIWDLTSVVAEGARAAGEKVTDIEVGRLLVESGPLEALDDIGALLTNALLGGQEPGEAGAAGEDSTTSPSVAS